MPRKIRVILEFVYFEGGKKKPDEYYQDKAFDEIYNSDNLIDGGSFEVLRKGDKYE
jgi:hypothetical protein